MRRDMSLHHISQRGGVHHGDGEGVLVRTVAASANAVVGLLAGHPKLVKTVHRHAPQDFGIPAVGLHELFFGAYRSSHQTRLATFAGYSFR